MSRASVEAVKDVAANIKHNAPRALRSAAGGMAVALALPGVAAAHSCHNHGRQQAPSPAALIKKDILRHQQAPVDPSEDVIWQDAKGEHDTQLPLKVTVDGQDQYFRLVQTARPNANPERAYATIDVVRIPQAAIVGVVSGEEYPVTPVPAGFPPTPLDVITVGNDRVGTDDGNVPAVVIRLTGGSEVLAAAGQTVAPTTGDLAALAPAATPAPGIPA